jgi:hypothetical protein
MAENEKASEIKEYAGGWISERKNTDVPTFLKFAYVVITLGCVGYCIRFMNGVIGDTDRGRLVEELNRATQGSNAFMYIVAALGLIAGVSVAVFAFRKFHED